MHAANPATVLDELVALTVAPAAHAHE